MFNDWFKINGKEMIKIPEKGEYVRFRNYERKIKSALMIYADLERILLPEDNVKKNPDEPYRNKYQKHVPCTHCYKLVCVDDKLSKPFKSYLGKADVYNFNNSVIK